MKNGPNAFPNRPRITAAVFAVSAGAAGCATTTAQSGRMSFRDYVRAHPECIRVTEGESVTIRDETACEEPFLAYEREMTRSTLRGSGAGHPPPRPANADEGARYQRRLDEMRNPHWWNANMVQRSGETSVQWAQRVDDIASDFLKGRLGEMQYLADEKREDPEGTIGVQQTIAAIVKVGQNFLDQAVKAWTAADRLAKAKDVQDRLGWEIKALIRLGEKLACVKK